MIGSGFVGLSAAIQSIFSASDDAWILIVEMMPAPGGNSLMNAGQIAAVGSKAQQLAGIDDSVELKMKDMSKERVGLNYPCLNRKSIDGSNQIVKWAVEQLGIETEIESRKWESILLKASASRYWYF